MSSPSSTASSSSGTKNCIIPIDLTASSHVYFIGLDVSTSSTGYAVIAKGTKVEWGAIKNTKTNIYDYAEEIKKWMIKLKGKYEIENCEVAIEEPLKGHIKTSLKTVSQLGIIFGMAHQICVDVFECEPSHVMPNTYRKHFQLTKKRKSSGTDESVKERSIQYVEKRSGCSLSAYSKAVAGDVADAFLIALFRAEAE